MNHYKIGKLYSYQKKSYSSVQRIVVYEQCTSGVLINPINHLHDGELCCVIQELQSNDPSTTILKVIKHDGIIGFVILTTYKGSIYSLTEVCD